MGFWNKEHLHILALSQIRRQAWEEIREYIVNQRFESFWRFIPGTAMFLKVSQMPDEILKHLRELADGLALTRVDLVAVIQNFERYSGYSMASWA